MNRKNNTAGKTLAITLVTLMLLSTIVAPFSVGLAAGQESGDDDDSKGGTIVGGGGNQDAAEQHPSQYNDEGQYSTDNNYETDNIPPVTSDYADAAKGTVSSFSNIRTVGGSATFSPNDNGQVAVGVGTSNIPNNNFYTLGINHNIPSGTTVKVTPVRPSGEAIDNTYVLDGSSDVSNIQLSSDERSYIRQTGNLFVVVTACNAQGDFSMSEMTLVASSSEKRTGGLSDTVSGLSQSQLHCGGTTTNENTDPVIDSFSIEDADGDGTIDAGEQITFDGSASDAEGDTLTYNWEIEADNGNTAFSRNGETVTESLDAGTYTATLRVSDGHGGLATQSQEFTVESTQTPDNDDTTTDTPTTEPPTTEEPPEEPKTEDPVAQIVVRGAATETDYNLRTTGVYLVQGETATFDGRNSHDTDSVGSGVVSYDWDIDGMLSGGTSPSISRSFSDAGTYTVTLTVTDNEGETDTATQTVTVQPRDEIKTKGNQPPVAPSITAEASDNPGDRMRVEVTVNGQATDPNDKHSDLSYQLDCGNGVYRSTGPGDNGKYICYYTERGNYDITLTVEDPYGETDTSTDNAPFTKEHWCTTLAFNPCGEVASDGSKFSISADSTTIQAGETVQFDSTLDGWMNLNPTYYWSYGDSSCTGEKQVGSTMTMEKKGCQDGSSSSYTYEEPGTYTVSVLAKAQGITPWGTTKDITRTDTVTITVEGGETKQEKDITDVDDDNIPDSEDDCIDADGNGICDGEEYTEYHWTKGIEQEQTKIAETSPGSEWTKGLKTGTTWESYDYVTQERTSLYTLGADSLYRIDYNDVKTVEQEKYTTEIQENQPNYGSEWEIVDSDARTQINWNTDMYVTQDRISYFQNRDNYRKGGDTKTVTTTDYVSEVQQNRPNYGSSWEITDPSGDTRVEWNTDMYVTQDRISYFQNRDNYRKGGDTKTVTTTDYVSEVQQNRPNYGSEWEIVDSDARTQINWNTDMYVTQDRISYFQNRDNYRKGGDTKRVKTTNTEYRTEWRESRGGSGEVVSTDKTYDTDYRIKTTEDHEHGHDHDKTRECVEYDPWTFDCEDYDYTGHDHDTWTHEHTEYEWYETDVSDRMRAGSGTDMTVVDTREEVTDTDYKYEYTVEVTDYITKYEVEQKNVIDIPQWSGEQEVETTKYEVEQKNVIDIPQWSGEQEVETTKYEVERKSTTNIPEWGGYETVEVKKYEVERGTEEYEWSKTVVQAQEKTTLYEPAVSQTYSYKVFEGMSSPPMSDAITQHTHNCNQFEGEYASMMCGDNEYSGGL